MPTVELKTKTGSGAGSVALNDKFFAAKINKGLVFQAVMVETNNSRQGTQSTKTRATVHHTTRKPYKQKGTGRARQGMTSAPHYRHGGVAMGPLPRDVHKDLPKKMRRAAIASALSSKAADGAVQVVDTLGFDSISTKNGAALIAELGLTGKRILFVVPQNDPIFWKSVRNIQRVEVRVAPGFSARDILAAETIVFAREALERIDAVWGEA